MVSNRLGRGAAGGYPTAMKTLRSAFAALLLATPAAAQSAAAADRWWATVAELADDRYEGRLTGTPGYDRAAAHVAERFAALGLRPAGDGGTYLQSVPLVERAVDQARSTLTLTGPGGRRAFKLGEEAVIGNSSNRPAVDAQLVLIGYGLSMPEVGHDDFAGLDLRGKIVVLVGGGPADVSAALKADAARNAFGPALERAGAVGAISLSDPARADIPWARARLLARAPAMLSADPALRSIKGPSFSAAFDPALAPRLFAGSGRTLAGLFALARDGKPLPRFALRTRLAATLATTERALASPNVVALLPGRDPALKEEHIVLSAHLDGLGVGAAIAGDAIHNGAMDNATGVASLLEAAAALVAAPPRRSVVFLAVTAEEKGLLGSRHYAVNPTVPAAGIVANVNMDMYLPLWPLTHLIAIGADQSSLGAPAAAAAVARGLTLVPDPEPHRNIFVRSDQYSFIREGVPALMLRFASSTPEQEAAGKAWLTTRYHAPSDDVAQPIERAAAAAFNVYLGELIGRIANAPARPAWNADSFFRRYAKAAADAPAVAN